MDNRAGAGSSQQSQAGTAPMSGDHNQVGGEGGRPAVGMTIGSAMASTGGVGATTGVAGTMAVTQSVAAGSGAAGSATLAMAGRGAAAIGTSGVGMSGVGGAASAGAPGVGAAGAGAMIVSPKVRQACLKAPSNVVFIGDSYINYSIAHPELNGLVAADAINDGALQSGQNYTDYAVAGTTLASGSAMIPGMWTQAKAANANIQVVIMDGGINDVLINNMQCKASGSSMDATCKQVVANSLAAAKMMISDMKASGVTEVIYFFYPHPPTGASEIIDYSSPMVRTMCDSLSDDKFQCRFLDTVSLFDGHNNWYATDGIHANAMGEQAIADMVWKQAKADCAAQASSSGCCTP
jgi:lysophospholipase L1-like esterase